ncbi:MAG: hypothetical protein JWP87_2261 [Labilithrix sp.]|nr:hypothetical protein [Labilithrix sp.]
MGALRCSLLTDTDGLAGSESDASLDGALPTVDGSAADRPSTPDSSVDGASAGEVFASGQTGAFGLARLGTNLYWTSGKPGGEVASCPLAACVTPTVVASGAKATTAMAALGRVYWMTPGTKTISYTQAGGSVGHFEAYSPVSWIGAGMSFRYVIEESRQFTLLQGDPPVSTTSFLGFDAYPDRAAGHDGAVAWTSGKTMSVGYCGSGGCDASTSDVSKNESAVAIALDASFLFWTTTDGRIRAAAHDGVRITSAAVTDIASGLAEPCALAPDEVGPFLYFATRGSAAGGYLDGIVGKLLKTGGPVTVLATGQARPANILLTETHLFWANEYDGTIRRLPK